VPAVPSCLLELNGEIARKGVSSQVQIGGRWVIERTDKNGHVVDFDHYLAAALVTVRQLIQRARHRYRWDGRPTTRRLK
jgi:hypothetical protein